MFPAMWPGVCADCGLDWDEGDLIGYVDEQLVCDACWNEADLEETRADMTAGGLIPGPLPGGIEKPRDVRKPYRPTAGAPVCPRCHLIQPCDCEEPAVDSYLQAIIDAAAAQLAAPPASPEPPAVSPELQAIIDAAAAKLAPPPEWEQDPTGIVILDADGQPVPKGELWRICADCNAHTHICPGCGEHLSHWGYPVCGECRAEQEPPKDPWSGLTPELQAVVDAAKAAMDPLTAPPVEGVVVPPVEHPGTTVEYRQGEIILRALGLQVSDWDVPPLNPLEAALDALAPYQGLPERGMETVVNDLMEFLVNAINNQERSQQRTIGPSEIGIECDHCLAAKLAGWREKRDGAWLPTVGTAVHEWIEKKFREAMLKLVPKDRRYLTELKVFCGYINGEEIWGSVDIVDLVAGVAGDWKIVGITTLKDVAASGEPSAVYKIQRQIYMHGLNTMGIRVDRGVIGYLPRNSPKLSDAEWPDEEYLPEVAVAAMERADTMARFLAKLEAELGTEARDAHISLLPRQRGKDGRISCYSCKRYDDFPAEAERLPVDHTFGGLIGD